MYPVYPDRTDEILHDNRPNSDFARVYGTIQCIQIARIRSRMSIVLIGIVRSCWVLQTSSRGLQSSSREPEESARRRAGLHLAFPKLDSIHAKLCPTCLDRLDRMLHERCFHIEQWEKVMHFSRCKD